MRPKASTPARESRPCEQCGGVFEIYRSDLARRPGRFCSLTCSGAAIARPRDERFWEKVNKNGPIPEARPDLGPCWLWTASLNPQGYGKLSVSGESVGAHLWAYRRFVGTIPEGFHVDHLCRVRRCVNYERHLEPVPAGVNATRGMAPNMVISREGRCAVGHPLVTRTTGKRAGRSECRDCSNEARRARRALAPRVDRYAIACPNGHPRTPENHYVGPKGLRVCRECLRAKNARAYWKAKAGA